MEAEGLTKEAFKIKGKVRVHTEAKEFDVDTLKYKKIYIDFIPKMAMLSNSALIVFCQVLIALPRRAETVHLNSKILAKEKGISKRTIDRGIKELKDIGLLRKKTIGVYYINTNYIYNGKR